VKLAITPHIAQKDSGSAIDGRTTRTVGGLQKLRHRGGELVDWVLT
jgi:hypothetical protein